uniref:Bm1364 n=1 Tax=Brugia malayi TaxID=6279 RepID=A0A1I9G2U3_BRUMA|nr:Bm1364 [Brugia malayi]
MERKQNSLSEFDDNQEDHVLVPKLEELRTGQKNKQQIGMGNSLYMFSSQDIAPSPNIIDPTVFRTQILLTFRRLYGESHLVSRIKKV